MIDRYGHTYHISRARKKLGGNSHECTKIKIIDIRHQTPDDSRKGKGRKRDPPRIHKFITNYTKGRE